MRPMRCESNMMTCNGEVRAGVHPFGNGSGFLRKSSSHDNELLDLCSHELASCARLKQLAKDSEVTDGQNHNTIRCGPAKDRFVYGLRAPATAFEQYEQAGRAGSMVRSNQHCPALVMGGENSLIKPLT